MSDDYNPVLPPQRGGSGLKLGATAGCGGAQGSPASKRRERIETRPKREPHRRLLVLPPQRGGSGLKHLAAKVLEGALEFSRLKEAGAD